MELFQVKTLAEIHLQLDACFSKQPLKCEDVYYLEAVGRILAADMTSPEALPAFRRSTVDGYAVLASDTAGASESIPAFLSYQGEVAMGEPSQISIRAGQTAYVPTGGEVPSGADAVVMLEYAEIFGDEIALQKPVRSKENLMDIGDDVKAGNCVIPKGTRLEPRHIAVLAALGQTRIQVIAKPRVSLISTGDELIDPEQKPEVQQIRDVNGPTLKAFLEAAGCDVIRALRLKDEEAVIFEALQAAIKDSELVLVSGGSSVGKKDQTPELIHALGKPGVLAHGIAMKPGKPTIVGVVEGCAVFGLPGQPTSCMMAYMAVVQPFIEKHLLPVQGALFKIPARAKFQAHSASGRTEFLLVTLSQVDGHYEATLIPGKSGMVTLLSQGVGFIEMPLHKGGILMDEKVEVQLFQSLRIGG